MASMMTTAVSRVVVWGAHVDLNVPSKNRILVIASGATRPDRREEVLLGCNLIAVRLDATVQSTG